MDGTESEQEAHPVDLEPYGVMMSKRKNFQKGRRRLRRMEKQAGDGAPTRDKTLGRACRRGWGAGKVAE